MAMGAGSYRRAADVLQRWFADAFGPLFRELSCRFSACADILRVIRESHEEIDDLGVLYAAWLETGNEDIAARLRRQGLVLPSRPPAGTDAA